MKKNTNTRAANFPRAAARLALSVAALALALAPAGRALAQGQPQAAPGQDKTVSRSKVERKNRAPVSKDILRVKLPKAVETKLDNGLTVLVLEDHRFPVVNLRLSISGAGPVFEPADRPGLANVTAQMLREGTKTRTSRQIAEEIERLGASLTASSGYGSSAAAVNASGLSDNFDQWFALYTDVLLNPTFPADELAKLKTRLKTSLSLQRTQPFFLAEERFRRAVYGDHPAAVYSTTPEVLDSLTPEMLARWHSERYAPQNAILGIAGDVNPQDVIAKLRQAFAGWKKTDYKEVLPPNPKPAASKKIFLIDRPDSVQSTITMGNIAIDRRSPDYVPVVVMDSVVGGGSSARLFLNLREDKGYTYGVYSGFTALKYPGPWSAGGDVRTEVTEGAMNELIYELKRIRDEPVPAAELEEKKRAIVAGFALSLESPATLLNYEVLRKIYDLPADYWDTYPARIMAVTAEDVQRVARRYVNPEAHQVVVVGDAGKIRSILEKFGPVEVYNTEGRPLAETVKPNMP
ncbi:MAG TPA: pitrilysin family protein [Pyrinomonadaceae bacterium]|nr:pitrilysin family protein [Pyrinomonadaceae bacterium]